MGIHDRDYYRHDARGMFDSWGRTSVTIWLIVITSIMFLAQVVSRDISGAPDIILAPVSKFLIYHPALVMKGEVWRLLTPVFLHAGLFHLAFNMLVLYWAGSRMEEHYGSREFLLFYLMAGLISGVANFAFDVAGLSRPAFALGASGAVMAVMILFACHYPRQIVLLFFVLPVPIWLLAVGYVVLDLLGAFGFGEAGIGHIAHLAGAAFGLVYYRFGWRIAGWLPSIPARSRQRSAPRLRVVPRDRDSSTPDEPEPVAAAVEAPSPPRAADEQFEARVDEVLQKVSSHGQESLTPEEREILFRASEVYKKKRK